MLRDLQKLSYHTYTHTHVQIVAICLCLLTHVKALLNRIVTVIAVWNWFVIDSLFAHGDVTVTISAVGCDTCQALGFVLGKSIAYSTLQVGK
jgi:hypothetical protein